MRTLVLGGAGYIGSHISEIIDTVVFDSLLFEDRFLTPVPFIYGDVRNLDELEIVHDYDTIVVLAGIVGDAACAVDPNLTHDTNVKHVKWLADNYKGKIIFTSTCSVYGKNDSLLDEDSPTNPLSIYAETKLEAERYLLEKRPDSLVFRLGTLYGMSGAFSRPRLDLVVNVLTQKAVAGETLTVFGGEQWRPILHVKDVAEAVKYGLENNLSGLYNLGSENVTIKEIAEKLIDIVPGNIEYQDILFEDKRNYKVSFSRIQKAGWAPKHSFIEGVRDMAEVFSQNRIKNMLNPLYHNANYMKGIYG